MVSICLKSTNTKNLQIIEEKLNKIIIPEIYYSQKKFKYFNNLIIHYKGSKKEKFFNTISKILSSYIIENYESKIINQQIYFDFFYFSENEKNIIKKLVHNNLNKKNNKTQKQTILQNIITSYFLQENICILEGFINFRIYEYKIFLNKILETTINDYILKKEYSEYVNLLQEYVAIEPAQCKTIYLLYTPNVKILLDSQKNVITSAGNTQLYLSDISFSSNDFILNSLLSLLPENLNILLDGEEDNFIKFLKLIFKGRFTIQMADYKTQPIL